MEAEKATADYPTVLFLPQWYRNPYQRLLDEELTRLGVRVQRVPSGIARLVRSLLFDRPAILHLHWLQPFYEAKWRVLALFKFTLFRVAVRWLTFRGTRIVWTVHNLRDHEQRFPVLDWRCVQFVAGRADSIIVHCAEAARQLQEQMPFVPNSRVRVIPHGHFMDAYPHSKHRSTARQELGVAENRLMLLFFGNIRPYKGVLELIEAFTELKNENVELWIVGRPLVEKESELVRERVAAHSHIHYRPGFVADDQIQTYMNACDAVVLPYRDVLTSGAAVLAMSFGRACIAPRIGCMDETVTDEGGFLYDAHDPGGLLDAIRAAVARRDDLAEMGENNRRVARGWGWERIAAMTFDAYRAAMAR